MGCSASAWFVRDYRVHLSENPFTCGGGGKDLPPSLALVQHQPTHSKGRHPGVLSAGRPFTLGKGMRGAMSVGKPSSAKTGLLSTTEVTLEKNLMSALNVEKPFAITPVLLYTREFVWV